MTPETLATYSLVAVYSAIAVYALAFIVYVLDLSKRTALAQAAPVAAKVPVRAYVGASAGQASAARGSVSTGSVSTGSVSTGSTSGSTGSVSTGSVSTGSTSGSVPSGFAPETRHDAGASRYLRTAFALTLVAWVIHLTALVLRGLAASRVPWANMFEFALTGTAVIVGVFLLVQVWRDLRFLGAYVTAVVMLLLGLGTVNFYVDVTPTPPPLQSAWLVIHVFVATLATGFFAVGGGLSIAQLLQARRESGKTAGLRLLQTFPSSAALETLANRVIIVGFAFWTFTLMAGAIWAERAWGRYWGWDTKEVWTFIIWTVFAGYIHARATRGWRGSRSAWLAIIGLGAVLFNFTIVNLFFAGLHSYSGL